MSYGQPQQQQQEVEKSIISFAGVLTQDPSGFTANSGTYGVNIDFIVTTIGQEPYFGQATYWGTDAYIAVAFLKKGSGIHGTARQFIQHYNKKDGTPGYTIKYDGITLGLDAKDVATMIDEKINEFAVKHGIGQQQQQQQPAVQQQQQQQPVAQQPAVQQQVAQQQVAQPVAPVAPLQQQVAQQQVPQPSIPVAQPIQQPVAQAEPILDIQNSDLPF